MSNQAEQYDFKLLREVRKRIGMTIGDLSSKSGVSAAVISRLERNESLPGIDTLFRIGKVLGMTASDVLFLCEKRTSQKRSEDVYEREGLMFRRVRFGNVTTLYVTGEAGASLSHPDAHGDDYELCWVLEGRMSINLPDECHELAAGDSLQFDAMLNHRYTLAEATHFVLVQIRKEKRF